MHLRKGARKGGKTPWFLEPKSVTGVQPGPGAGSPERAPSEGAQEGALADNASFRHESVGEKAPGAPSAPSLQSKRAKQAAEQEYRVEGGTEVPKVHSGRNQSELPFLDAGRLLEA